MESSNEGGDEEGDAIIRGRHNTTPFVRQLFLVSSLRVKDDAYTSTDKLIVSCIVVESSVFATVKRESMDHKHDTGSQFDVR